MIDIYRIDDGEDVGWFGNDPDPGNPHGIVLIAALYDEDAEQWDARIVSAFWCGAKRQPAVSVFDMGAVDANNEDLDTGYPGDWEALQDRFGQDYDWRGVAAKAFADGGINEVSTLARTWWEEDTNG